MLLLHMTATGRSCSLRHPLAAHARPPTLSFARRRGDTNTTADDVPEEGVRDGPLQLRCRWYRSTLSRGGQVCCVHPEAEAALQCLLCLRLKAPTHLSFHCSADCMKKHWQAHREYHSAAAAAENRRRTENGGAWMSVPAISLMQ